MLQPLIFIFTFSPSSQGDWIVRGEIKETPVLKTLKDVCLPPPYFYNFLVSLRRAYEGHLT